MTQYLRASLAVSTRAAYDSATRSFIEFAILYNCLSPDRFLLPALEDTLMLFTTYLASSLKPQSIKVYLYGIRSLHLDHGFPDPLAHALHLRRLLRGIKRTKGTPRDSRLPVTPSLLRAFYCLLNTSSYDHRMLWAALLVAFFGFLRSSELLALHHGDLTRVPSGYCIAIRASKVDPFRQGATVRVTTTGDALLCAVRALDHLLANQQVVQGPVFRFQCGTQLSRQKLNLLIHELAQRVGIPAQRYSSHSFRIGAASTAAAMGIPDWKIRALGRWASDCYRRYIRLPEADTDQVAPLLAKSQL